MKSALVDPPKAYVRYLEFPGAEPPLVFLPGLGCSATIDYPVVATRQGLRGRRSLQVDLFGHGYSDAPDQFSYSLEDHARSVGTLLDQLGITRCVLYGHSMGGSIAITLAALRADLVERLVISEANLDPGGGFVSRDMAQQSPEQMPALLDRLLADGRVSPSRFATFRAASPMALQRSAAGLVKGTKPTMRERLYDLAIPRAYIISERSLPDPNVEVLEAHGVRVPVVPAAGHDMAFENPDGLAEQIAAQLSS